MSQVAEKFAVPALGPPRTLRTPKVAESKLRNGLRVLVVRKPTVPRIEMRLIIPLGDRRNAAAERVLAKTLLSGTSSRASAEIAQELQRLGASLGAAPSADNLHVSGSVLAPNLGAYLGLVSEILTDSIFPSTEVSLERGRVSQEISIARSQPQVLAAEVLMRRLFGRHHYSTVLPAVRAVERIASASLKTLFDDRITPRGAVLVLVGDVPPQSALDIAASAFSRWRGGRAAPDLPDPAAPKLGPMVVVDRPGSVQTNIRLAGPTVGPSHDDAVAIDVANTIFGGYFVSRFVENLRERNGYTYSPHSYISHRTRASTFELGADVGAEVTAPSLVETQYELGRMSALPVEAAELESAQRYLTGVQSIRIQSQAGLASTLAGLVVHGLDVGYLRDYPRRVNAITAADVREASVRYLSPARLVTVLVGDAALITREVSALGDVQVGDAG